MHGKGRHRHPLGELRLCQSHSGAEVAHPLGQAGKRLVGVHGAHTTPRRDLPSSSKFQNRTERLSFDRLSTLGTYEAADAALPAPTTAGGRRHGFHDDPSRRPAPFTLPEIYLYVSKHYSISPRPGDGAAQAFEGVALARMAHGCGMQGESRELGDAGAVRRGAGRDGVWGERLAPGAGPTVSPSCTAARRRSRGQPESSTTSSPAARAAARCRRSSDTSPEAAWLSAAAT